MDLFGNVVACHDYRIQFTESSIAENDTCSKSTRLRGPLELRSALSFDLAIHSTLLQSVRAGLASSHGFWLFAAIALIMTGHSIEVGWILSSIPGSAVI